MPCCRSPCIRAKRLLRGVNSPELLAGCLGKKLGVPVVRSLVRCRYTGPQKDLLPRQRFRDLSETLSASAGRTSNDGRGAFIAGR